MSIGDDSECGFINNIYISHRLFGAVCPGPKERAQLCKAAALRMYTRHKSLNNSIFLYSGGNKSCRAEQRMAKVERKGQRRTRGGRGGLNRVL